MKGTSTTLGKHIGYVAGGLLFVCAGALSVANGNKQISLNQAISVDPQTTTGEVVQTEVDQAWGFQPVVTFDDHNQTERSFSSLSYYRWFWRPDEGESLPIKYLAGDPDLALIDTFWGRNGLSLEFGVIGGVILLFGLAAVISAFSILSE